MRSITVLPVVDNGWSCDRLGGLDAEVQALESLFPMTDHVVLDRVKRLIDEDDAQIVVGLSGGKDSICCCLLLWELGIPFTAVFADTKWESKLTYAYVRWFCDEYRIPLVVVSNEKFGGGLVELIKHKGCFPKMKRRFCTEELKENPIAEYIESLKAEGKKVISVAGIRAAESQQRAKMQTWSEHDSRFGCSVWHPIFSWSYEDTIAMHHRHGCKPNPLYLLGAERVGCFPCVFGKKSELRIVSILEPDRIGVVRQLESDIDESVRQSKGDKYEERNYPTSTMFWMSVNGQSRPALIDDVIQRSWVPANAKERALISDSLASQAAAAQKRWGFSLEIPGLDLKQEFVESDEAVHADYSHRYKTVKDLKAESELVSFVRLPIPKGSMVRETTSHI